ncbi:hypothetical protein BC828DRAFT_384371 [Blastocladiella britannica]|nr:hypothetical protein BC828DRAFT_384371 [Blastocladiella britannica]
MAPIPDPSTPSSDGVVSPMNMVTTSPGYGIEMTADMLIAISYFAIPCVLLYFAHLFQLKKIRMQYRLVVLMFLGFIVLCGVTHLLHAWLPDEHGIAIVFRGLTALVSVMTAIVIFRLVPTLLQLPTRLYSLEEELGVRIARERELKLENSNLNKLRNITHAVRRPLTVLGICDVAAAELSSNFELDACYIISVDFKNPSEAACLASACSKPHFNKAVGTKLNLTALLGASGGMFESQAVAVMDPAAAVAAAANAAAAASTGAAAKTAVTALAAAATLSGQPSGDDVADVNDDGECVPLVTPPPASTSNIYTATHPPSVTETEVCVRVPGYVLSGVLGHAVKPNIVGTLTQVYDGSAHMTSESSSRIDGNRVLVLMMHRRTALKDHGAVIADAVGQVELALAQSVQIERDAAHRAQVSVLEREKREAEALNGMKTVFLATISHELRTPMNAIIGFIDLLLTQFELTEDMREILEIVSLSSNTLLTLVNDILDLSKLEFHGNTFDMEEGPISIVDKVEQSIELVYPGADKKGILVTGILDNDIDKVLGDKLRVRQILVNVVSNAIKFTTAGSVTITATNNEPASYFVDAEGGRHRKQRILDFYHPTELAKTGRRYTRVFFQVRDTGIGIAQDKIHLLFEKFQQVDSTIARRFQGTGLGLAITSRLVELHHGRIIVDSVPGVGSVFTVMLCFPVMDEPGPLAVMMSPSTSMPPKSANGSADKHEHGHGPLPVSQSLASEDGGGGGARSSSSGVDVPLAGTRVGLFVPLEPVRTSISTILRRNGCVSVILDDFPLAVPGSGSLGAPGSGRTLANFGFPTMDVLMIDELMTRRFSPVELARLSGVSRLIPVICITRSKMSMANQRTATTAGMSELNASLHFSLSMPIKKRHLEETLRNALYQFKNGLLSKMATPAVSTMALVTNVVASTAALVSPPTGGASERSNAPKSAASPSFTIISSTSPPSGVATTTDAAPVTMAPTTKPAATKLSPGGNPPPVASKLHVLVTDDNGINQMVAVRTLKSMGIENVHTANNGAEAVAFVETNPDVAICFMDVSMPIMDGLDATRAILTRAQQRGSKHQDGRPFICAMTASALPEERNTCLAAGMHDFVAKPARRQDLVALIQRYEQWRTGQGQ